MAIKAKFIESGGLKNYFILGDFMKKILVSLTLCGALCASMSADEENGFLLGISAGGAVSLNAMNNSNAGGSTTLFLGVKGGYQAFFVERHGVRFYLSFLAAYGFYPATQTATTANASVPLAHDMYYLVDLNADYLFNWTDESDYTAGLFAGFFTGALIGQPMTNSRGSQALGSTLGINVGVRTTINHNHQVEFGIKSALAFFTRSNTRNDLGTLIGLQTSYIYKF